MGGRDVRLRVRAAAGFEELTPRSSFADVYELLGTEKPTFDRTRDHITEITRQIRSLQVRAAASSPRLRGTTRKETLQGVRARIPGLFAPEENPSPA